MDPIETDTERLIEAREQADGGVRLAMPQLAEMIGLGATHPSQPPAELDAETAEAAGRALGRAREEVVAAALPVPFEGHDDLHLRFNGLVNEMDRIGAILAERTRD